jgi:hypothetical protein
MILKEPKQMAIRAIVDNSVGDEYDNARFEWELEAVLADDSEGFNNVCDLCGNPSLKNDFVIYNPSTSKRLNVGSSCIVRFGVVKGNVDVESGQLLINNFLESQNLSFQVRSLVKGMMVRQPDAKDFQMFYKSLKKILDSKNLTKPTIEELGDICYGERWGEFQEDEFIRERLRLIWYRPMIINDMTVKTKVKKDREIKEGSTFGHKSRTSVYMPAAGRSNLYKTDNISDE